MPSCSCWPSSAFEPVRHGIDPRRIGSGAAPTIAGNPNVAAARPAPALARKFFRSSLKRELLSRRPLERRPDAVDREVAEAQGLRRGLAAVRRVDDPVEDLVSDLLERARSVDDRARVDV